MSSVTGEFSGVSQRLTILKEQPRVLGDIAAQRFEFENLITQSTLAWFNRALTDPINVTARISKSKLARVNAI